MQSGKSLLVALLAASIPVCDKQTVRIGRLEGWAHSSLTTMISEAKDSVRLDKVQRQPCMVRMQSQEQRPLNGATWLSPSKAAQAAK